MSDALSKFDFSKVIKTGSYLKFVPGEPVTMRILTTDPIIFSASFEDKRTGEEIVTTKFAWIIYNFTGEVAQVMETTPNLAKKIGELHKDPDFGEDIKKLTIKVTPPAPGEIKAYDLQVLPSPRQLTQEQVDECRSLDLDKLYKEKGGNRISLFPGDKADQIEASSGHDKAKSIADELRPDEVEDIGDEPINLDDIPF